MNLEFKHYFQELCRRINYRCVVFIKETGEVLAFHDNDHKETPTKCILRIAYDSIPKENSKVFYGLPLTFDNETVICSGSANIIDIEGAHVVIVFFENNIPSFRDNQLPRILWKTRDHLYLGHSDYVPFENSLKHTMVGYTDSELFKENMKDTFKTTDEAIFTKEVCFWDTFGTIRVNAFTSLIKYHKFPYYSLHNELMGVILVYTPINETSSFISDTNTGLKGNANQIIKEALANANILMAIQNAKNGQIEFISNNIISLGYQLEQFVDGTLHLRDIMHKEDEPQYRKGLNDVLYLNKQVYKNQCRVLTAEKDIVHVKMTFIPILDSSKDIQAIVFLMELIEFLEKAESKNKVLLSLANKAHIIYTLRNVSQPMTFDFIGGNISQFGYSESDFVKNKFAFRDIIYHDDIDFVEKQIQKIFDDHLNFIRFEYRILSRRKELYWVEERIYKVVIDGHMLLESTIKNVTTSKSAIDDLQKMQLNVDRSISNVNQIHDLEIHLQHVLEFIDMKNQILSLAKATGMEIAFYNNSDELVSDCTSSREKTSLIITDFYQGQSQNIKSLPKSPFSNVFVKTISLENKSYRIGSIVVFGLIEDELPGIKYIDQSHLFEPVPLIRLDSILEEVQKFSRSVGYMIFTTTLAMFQIQSTSSFRGDMSKARNKHAILLEVLNIANHSENLETCFDGVYAKIADVFELSRGSFFRYDDIEDDFSCTKEWISDLEVPHIHEYQKVKKNKTFYANWNFDEQNSFVIDYEDEVEEHMHFRDYAKAIVGVRVYNKNRLFGILNFVDNHSMRSWSDDDIMLFEDISYIFSSVVEKSLSHEQLRVNQQQIVHTLDSLPNAVAIFARDTQKLIHANKSFVNIFDLSTNSYSYPLEELKAMITLENTEQVTKEIYLEDIDRWFQLEKSPVDFGFDEATCMMILTDLTENKKNAEMMANIAFHDVLSGLPNRVKFELDLSQMYELSQSSFVNAFIGIINIDNFKMINNTFSYSYGDSLIKVLANLLNRIPEIKDCVYRFGGDEFSFIAKNLYGEQVYEVANKVMNLFEKPFYVEGYESYLTVSLGIGFLTDTDKDVNDLIRKANLSLMEAKVSGKNKYVLYDISLQKFEEDTLSLERALKTAVETGCSEFDVYFQPIVNAKTGKIVAAEALVRWFSKELGYMPPMKFIPAAESTGLIIPLGKYILNQACKEARKWLDYGYDIQVSVNFSVIQTLQSDLISIIISALHTYRLPPKNLMMEITESLAIKDMTKVTDILNSVRQIGVKIAMDDFGTGYSSLSHLRQLPLDYVKIDRSFAFNLEFDPYYFSFIETIVKFCHLNNTKVCCEGVENDHQHKILQNTSVDNLQGYLFGHPVSANDFWRMLVQNLK